MHLLHQGRQSRARPVVSTEDTEDAPPIHEFSPDRSLGELVREIVEDLTTLFRKEVQLAKQELSETIRTKLVAVASIALAVTIGLLIVPFALIALIEVLAIWLPRWGAALIVIGMMIALGVGAVVFARKKLEGGLMPKQSIESIKEDFRWAKSLKK